MELRDWEGVGAEGGTGGVSHPPFFLGPQIECSSISDYAVKIVKANKLDHGEPSKRTGVGGGSGPSPLPWGPWQGDRGH